MPRSFLVKKKEKGNGSDKKHHASQETEEKQDDTQDRKPVTSGGQSPPLPPLNRAVLTPHYFQTPHFQPWQDGIHPRDISSIARNAMMFPHRAPPFAAVAPYTPSLPPVAFTGKFIVLGLGLVLYT